MCVSMCCAVVPRPLESQDRPCLCSSMRSSIRAHLADSRSREQLSGRKMKKDHQEGRRREGHLVGRQRRVVTGNVDGGSPQGMHMEKVYHWPSLDIATHAWWGEQVVPPLSFFGGTLHLVAAFFFFRTRVLVRRAVGEEDGGGPPKWSRGM